MTKVPFTPPTFDANGFNRPFCHAYADQSWGTSPRIVGGTNHGADNSFEVCRCSRCKRFSVWIDGAMVHPPSSGVPDSNADMNPDIQDDYNEARRIVAASPRGAAALLRLAIQKLCRQLGQPGDNINADIGTLVKAECPLRCADLQEELRTELQPGRLGEFIGEWAALEGRLLDAARRQTERNLSVREAITTLAKRGTVDADQAAVLDSLRRFRNELVHTPSRVDPGALEEWQGVLRDVVRTLQKRAV